MSENLNQNFSLKSQEVLQLINSAFPGKDLNQYLLFDFPAWGIQSPDVQFFSESVNGKIVSLCGLFQAEYIHEGQKIKIGFIGAVCTDKNHRRRGYAKKVIKKAIEAARAKKLAALFLWGSEYALYQSLGFELCGQQIRFFIKSISFTDKHRMSPDESIKVGYHPFISETIQKRDEGVVWTEERLKTLPEQKNTEWVLFYREDKIVAFCGYHRGMDLKNIIHEWWGEDEESLKKLLNEVSLKNPELQIIGHRKIFDKYNLFSDSIIEEFLCMSLILDPYPWMKVIQTKTELGFVKNPDASWVITDFRNEKLISLKNGDLSRLFFGPASMRSPQMYTLVDSQKALIDLWFWGLDSL